MKKLLIFLLPLLFVACSEEDISKPDLHLCADIDGSTRLFTFNRDSTTIDLYNVAFNSTLIEKYETSDNLGPSFSLQINNLDLDNITYPFTIEATNVEGAPFMFWRYRVSEQVSFATGSSANTNLSMTLTSFENDILSGSFQGTLPRTFNSEVTRDITNGLFRIELVRR